MIVFLNPLTCCFLVQCIITRAMGDDNSTMVIDVYVQYIHCSRTFTLREELVY